MTAPLRRKSDTEQIAVNTVEISHLKNDVIEIKRICNGILRNQWIQCGVIAFVMVLLKYPQIAQLFISGSPAMAAGVK